MPLTATQVKQAKPQSKAYKLSDGKGLWLYIPTTGSKIWRHRYFFEGKEKMLSLGAFPYVSLQEARTIRDQQRTTLARGINPSQQRKLEKANDLKQELSIFSILAKEWFHTQQNHWEAKNAEKIWRRIEKHLLPSLGRLPIAEIESNTIYQTLRTLEQEGKHDTSRKLRQYLGQIFRYAAMKKLVQYNPLPELQGLIKAPEHTHYPHPKTKHEIGNLLNKLDEYNGSNSVNIALKLAPFVFLRPSELAEGTWTEIDFTNAIWEIPPERMKMKEPHLVPLARQPLELLKQLKELNLSDIYIFPSNRSRHKPISNGTLRLALRRIGITKEQLTTHGFRGMASTQLNELGYNRDWIERQLAHKESNSIRAAYNHAQYLEQRTQMMQEWANHLEKLKTSQ